MARGRLHQGPRARNVLVLAISTIALTVVSAVPANAATWSSGSSPSGFSSLSCLSSTYCVSLTGLISAMTYNGTSWSETSINTFGYNPVALSCVATTSEWCVAIQAYGGTYTYNGATWSDGPALTGPTNGGVAVSCASSTFCVAEVTNGVSRGDFEVYNGTLWSVDGHTVSDLTFTGQIDCPSTTFCAAIDQHHVFTFNGTAWKSTYIAASDATVSADMQAVTCRSPSYCIAIDGAGDTFRFNGATWSAAPHSPAAVAGLSTYYPTQLSCASTQLCLALSKGFAWEYNGFEWSVPVSVDRGGSGSLQNVDCTSPTFCMFTDGNQHYVVYRGGMVARFLASLTITASPKVVSSTSTVKLSVRVSGHPVPTGTVTVSTGGRTLCTTRLAGGATTCTIGPGRLPRGVDKVKVAYSGSTTYVASSHTVTVTVH